MPNHYVYADTNYPGTLNQLLVQGSPRSTREGDVGDSLLAANLAHGGQAIVEMSFDKRIVVDGVPILGYNHPVGDFQFESYQDADHICFEDQGHEDMEDSLLAANLSHCDQAMAEVLFVPWIGGSVPILDASFVPVFDHHQTGHFQFNSQQSFGDHDPSEGMMVNLDLCGHGGPEEIVGSYSDDMRFNFGRPCLHDPPQTDPTSQNGHSTTAQLLPAQLLLKIFSLYMVGGCDTLLPSNGPWLFTHICSSWRILALKTPELWACIRYVENNDAPTRNIDPNTNRAMSIRPRSHIGASNLALLALERSGGLPVSFQFQTSDVHLLYHPVFWALREHSARWVDANLECGVPLLELMAGRPLPCLVALSLLIPNKAQQPEHLASQLRSLSVFAPQLRTLTLSGFPGAPARMQLPWEQLTTYKSPYASAFEALAVLSCSRNIEYCSLRLESDVFGYGVVSDDEDMDEDDEDEDDILDVADEQDHGGPDGFEASLVLPRLQSFIFHTFFLDSSDDHPASILDEITLPSLTSLTISNYHRAGATDRLVALIYRSNANLTKFFFLGCTFTEADCKRLLEATPCLLELGIVDVSPNLEASHHFLAALTNPPALAPSLKVILISENSKGQPARTEPTLSHQPSHALYIKRLLDMIEFRWDPDLSLQGMGLERVELGLHDNYLLGDHKDASYRLHLLRGAGLSISVQEPWSADMYL